MIMAENFKRFKMSNKQMSYVIFAIGFVMVKDIFVNEFFKKNLNKCLLDKRNMANT